MNVQTKILGLSAYLISSLFVYANAASNLKTINLDSESTSTHSQQVIKKARNDRKLSSEALKVLVGTTSQKRIQLTTSHILHKIQRGNPITHAQ